MKLYTYEGSTGQKDKALFQVQYTQIKTIHFAKQCTKFIDIVYFWVTFWVLLRSINWLVLGKLQLIIFNVNFFTGIMQLLESQNLLSTTGLWDIWAEQTGKTRI